MLTDVEKESLTLPMLKRLRDKHPDAALPKLTIAHLALAKGSYADALKLYRGLFAQHEDSPMLSLCIGTGYLLAVRLPRFFPTDICSDFFLVDESQPRCPPLHGCTRLCLHGALLQATR